MNTKPDEFYIGWQDHAPAGIARRVRLAALGIALLTSLISGLLVLNQMGFAGSTFELGQFTELEGILQLEPVPLLRQFHGRDAQGQAVYQHILLVGKGKHGASDKLSGFANTAGRKLEGQVVKLEGHLIYHDGKTLFEVISFKGFGTASGDMSSPVASRPLGHGTLIGEISDPKCLFGVMKPGFGKPHRSCAARCLAGGIPPVLKTSTADGATRYYLLLGDAGEMINEKVLPFAGDQVFMCGRMEQFGDWFILYKKPDSAINLVPRRLKGNIALPLCSP